MRNGANTVIPPQSNGPDLRQVERLGNRAHPRPLGPHPVSKAAVTTRDRALCRWAKVMIARQTLVAEKAAVRKPSEPDALPDFKSFCFFPECGHRACHLMTGHEGIFGHTPIVIEHGEIRMTEATVADLDLDFFGSERTGIERERFQLSFRRVSGIGVIGMHRFSRLLLNWVIVPYFAS